MTAVFPKPAMAFGATLVIRYLIGRVAFGGGYVKGAPIRGCMALTGASTLAAFFMAIGLPVADR